MTMQVVELPTAKVFPRLDARQLDEAAVSELEGSIRNVGLMHPLRVRVVQRFQGGQLRDAWEISAGHHRYEALRRLGMETVPCVVVQDDDLHAELAMIDENLIRRNWSDAERPIKLRRRKEIYEALYPHTKRGANNQHTVANRQNGEEQPERFTKATAKTLGVSERAVQRDVARAEALGDEALLKVKGTSLDKGVELDALAALPEPERALLIEQAAAGEKVTARPTYPVSDEVMGLIRGTSLDTADYLGHLRRMPASDQHRAAERDLRKARQDAREIDRKGESDIESLKRELAATKAQVRTWKRECKHLHDELDRVRHEARELAGQRAFSEGVERQQREEIERLKTRLAAAGDGSVPILKRLTAALNDARVVLDEWGTRVPESGLSSRFTEPLEKEVGELEERIAFRLGDLETQDPSEITTLFSVTSAFGMPLAPWPHLKATDLMRMTKGRQNEARKRKVYIDRADHPLNYGWRWSAEKHREWLESADAGKDGRLPSPPAAA